MIQLPDRSTARRLIQFEIPFSGSLSKNKNFFAARSEKGAPIMKRRGSSKNIQRLIALLVSTKLGQEPWPEKTKTWIDIVVQKSSNRWDAQNVVDVLFDGIRDGLQVDDRWFAIGLLDWEIQPVDPNIYVQVSV